MIEHQDHGYFELINCVICGLETYVTRGSSAAELYECRQKLMQPDWRIVIGVVLQCLRNGESLAQAARTLGITRQRLHGWLRANPHLRDLTRGARDEWASRFDDSDDELQSIERRTITGTDDVVIARHARGTDGSSKRKPGSHGPARKLRYKKKWKRPVSQAG